MLKWTRRLLLATLALALLCWGLGWWLLQRSLPRLEGGATLPGLSALAVVERDALGVATVTAENRIDALRALGYVHAQERYFEMDLLRRSAAGELAALFGPAAVDADRRVRVHRMRAHAQAQLNLLSEDERELLAAYADGVAQGLADLGGKPWPYLLLRAEPQPWKPEDSLLTGYAMFFDLQDESNARELALWQLRQHLPPPLYALLDAPGTAWDAPLMGEARATPALPAAQDVDLRQLPAPEGQGAGYATPPVLGSNNFAVAGALTADGRAIVADDMHLGLRAPNIWFRARLRYADPQAPQGKVDVSGFTLPGIPAVIVGSNGHVAWGFTNSYGDWSDFVTVDWLDAERTRYPSPRGELQLTQIEETIEVKGGEPVVLLVRQTLWGPVLADVGDRQSLALRWVAHAPQALNMQLGELARAGDLDDALRRVARAGTPAQNLLIGDRHGRIAWRLAGRIPARTGACDPRQPIPAMLGCEWAGWLDIVDPARHPQIVDPPSHRLWSANARVADGEALQMIGDGGYALGARQRQIRDALLARDRFSERDLLAIQLDDRALFLEPWYRAFRARVEARRDDAILQRLEAATRNWEGRASVDSVSYRVARAWRQGVMDRIASGLTAPAQVALGEEFVMPSLPQLEGVAWQLLQQRPAHLLPRRYASWDALLDDAALEVAGKLAEHGDDLAARRWGERNTARICHPIARALPALAERWLCMPAEPLAGDVNMPRVVGPDFGASQRMVVSPGHEADGIIHMPGGQSGHPLSPFWGAGHDDWVQGRASAFLPGPTQYRLELRPQ